MAEGKNKIVFYADWKDSFEHLTDEEAGILIKHFFKYVNDENPILEDRLIQASWIPIEKTLKRDLKKWESYLEKQKANGKKGGRPKTQKTQAFLKKPKKAVNVNVSVNESTNVDYSEKDFLKNWNEARTHRTKQPSNLNVLRLDEADLFYDCAKRCNKEDFHKAIKGLFNQEAIPKDIMWFRPKHLLSNIETYIDAFNSQNFKLYA